MKFPVSFLGNSFHLWKHYPASFHARKHLTTVMTRLSGKSFQKQEQEISTRENGNSRLSFRRVSQPMSKGNTTMKCSGCNATVNANWLHCIACNAPLSPPLHVMLEKAVEGTTLTADEFRAELTDSDIEGVALGETSFECLQTAARTMAEWRKWTTRT